MYPGHIANRSHHMIAMWQKEWVKVWIPYSIPICLAIVVGNSIGVLVFMRKTFRRKTSNCLLLNLTFADLLVGVFGFVFDFFHVFSKTTHGQMAAVLAAIIMISSNTSMLSLAVIAFERLYAVFRPIQHRMANEWLYFVAIFFAWVISVLSSGLYVFHLSDTHHHSHEGFFLPFYLFTIFSLTTITVCYLAVWIKMKYFNVLVNNRSIQESNKLSKTLLIVTAISLCTWLPKVVVDGIKYVYPEKYTVPLSVSVTLLLYTNSFLNLIVYSFRMPEFRQELRNAFKMRKFRVVQVSSASKEASTVLRN